MPAAKKAAPKPRGPGRPAHVPDAKSRRIVETLAGFGLTHKQLGEVVGLDDNTLRKHYADELKTGAAKVEAMLVGRLMEFTGRKDMVGLRALVFALKSRFGWSEHFGIPVGVGGREEPLGKKAALDQAALTAHEEDPEWATLLSPTRN